MRSGGGELLSFSGLRILVSSFEGMFGGHINVGSECGRHGCYC
jgi:hypothetical protein